MCGIAGIYAYHYAANPVDAEELLSIRDHMTARGPDGAGAWYSNDRRVGLAHRRLAIIDLSDRGLQPMFSADRKITVTFNGEIYNYQALRAGLEARGHVFRTGTDTEVLLHLYAWKGREMVHDLRGMFAFALWDDEKRGLLLARDPYGIKPLYYADDGWTLRFASGVKALLAGGQVSREPELAGWAGFLLFGSVPEPFTIYQEVKAVPAGASIWVDRLGPRVPIQYFDFAGIFSSAQRQRESRQDRQVRVREALLDSVRHHLVSDVPIGLFLSAGINSGALLGLIRDAGQQQIQTITVTHNEFRNTPRDEATVAARIAAQYGFAHSTRNVSEVEFQNDLPRIFDAMDQPSVDGINTWFVSKAAHELGLKVAISGLGGDELFGGYPSFVDIPRWVRWFSLPARIPLLGNAFRAVVTGARQVNSGISPKAAELLNYAGTHDGAYLVRRGIFMPSELDQLMEGATEGLRRLDPLGLIAGSGSARVRSATGRVATLEVGLYLRNQLLRDTDWASMAHSLEVRVPLVDAELARAIAPLLMELAPGEGKRLIANSPSDPLRSEVVDHPKRGFDTPIAAWVQRDSRLQTWRRLPQLARPECHWSRRWVYELATYAYGT